ncbi:hypothetical protein GmRootA79_53650 (plasmid) [Acidovorax sp. A79]
MSGHFFEDPGLASFLVLVQLHAGMAHDVPGVFTLLSLGSASDTPLVSMNSACFRTVFWEEVKIRRKQDAMKSGVRGNAKKISADIIRLLLKILPFLISA